MALLFVWCSSGLRPTPPETADALATDHEWEEAYFGRRGSVPRFLPVDAAPPPKHFLAPQYLHDKEVRDDEWALAMEHALRTWMSPETLSALGLERVEIVELSCRRTTCRLVYEYPTALLDLVTRRGLPPDSPMVLVFEQQGPAASSFGGNTEDVMVRDGERYTRQSVVLGFDEASRDPRRHAEWARARIPRIKQVIERIRQRWEQKRVGATNRRRDGGS